jgi:hypothetical protein
VKPEKATTTASSTPPTSCPRRTSRSTRRRSASTTADALRRYKKGTFVYRLAGRDRQTSASYYTPEVLTRATVKYALKELLGTRRRQGRAKLSADEILHLTVCEPAMGSAAFLNEAVNQLAEAYLVAKQRELGKRIPHDEYAHEKQRVKMFIADNNVFGVDLNPVAVELAEVSLWLNTIHKGGFVPWFTGQTVCGNSLIGARRQVFPGSALERRAPPQERGAARTTTGSTPCPSACRSGPRARGERLSLPPRRPIDVGLWTRHRGRAHPADGQGAARCDRRVAQGLLRSARGRRRRRRWASCRLRSIGSGTSMRIS